MAAIKTAISIEASLFRKADRLARKLQVPRSKLFSLALDEFVSEHQNRKLLADLDRAYAAPPDRAERKLLEKAKGAAGARLKAEW